MNSLNPLEVGLRRRMRRMRRSVRIRVRRMRCCTLGERERNRGREGCWVFGL